MCCPAGNAPAEGGTKGSSWIKYPGLLLYVFRLAAQSLKRAVARLYKAQDYNGKLAEEASHWAGGERGHTWLDSRVINELETQLISGDPEVYWLLHFRRSHVPEALDRALNLGCGAGGLEINALTIGIARNFDSIDVSLRALELCRRREEIIGAVNYICADINSVELEPNRYDVVFAVNILHHLTELEHVLDEVRKALRPGGAFVIHEYVGPGRFQWTAAQLDAVNSALSELPRRYRRNRRRGGIKKRVYRPLTDELSPDSPFEAARSDEILKLIGERFECIEKVELGGALLHPLLEAIVGNFDEGSERDRNMLKALWNLEKDLMAKGILASDFVYAVFRRPSES